MALPERTVRIPQETRLQLAQDALNLAGEWMTADDPGKPPTAGEVISRLVMALPLIMPEVTP